MNLRRAAKATLRWGTTAAAVLIVGAWVGSGRCTFGQTKLARGTAAGFGQVTFPQRFIAVMHGVVYYSRFAPSPVPVGSSEYVYRVMGMKRTTWTWWFVYDDSPGGCNLQIPLWAPFLLTAAPAGFLWRGEIIARRRRR